MRTFRRWLPSWLRAGPTKGVAAAVYMSKNAVAIARSEQADGRMRVRLRADSVQHVGACREVLKLQAHDVGLKTARCNLVLAPELYSVSLVERPPVADEELRDAVRWKIQEHVEFPVEQATLDVFPLPEAASRDRSMVFVVAMQTEFLRALLTETHEAGIDVSCVDISELALRNVVHGLFPESDRSVALLRLTPTGGVVNISRGDDLFLSRRVAGVPEVFSESAWEDYRERLLLQVQRSIDYYESAMGQAPVNGCLVATTNGWQEQVCEYLGEMLPVPIQSIREQLGALFDIRLYNPAPESIDWEHASDDQCNALTAALPALGGLLRQLDEPAAAPGADSVASAGTVSGVAV